MQKPQEKINHAIVLGGDQGIGKDTLLEPVKHAIGPWNFSEVTPKQMLGRFNGFVKSTVLRISEAKDLGEIDRYTLYEHMKIYTAAPPDVLRVDEKFIREHSVLNCCGVIVTTNHKAAGIYLPADDRRHYVAWSTLSKENFGTEYFNNLWTWYEAGGLGHVAAYLAGLDLAGFNPKAPPPKTQAFWEIVETSRAPESAELADAIESMGSPPALTLEQLMWHITDAEFVAYLKDRKHRRHIPHRLEECGYVPVRNKFAKDGQWKVGGKRRSVYVKRDLPPAEQIAAAEGLAAGGVGDRGV